MCYDGVEEGVMIDQNAVLLWIRRVCYCGSAVFDVDLKGVG